MGTKGYRAVVGRRRSRGLEIWLQNEHLSEEERINRLAGDAELVAELRRAGFRGREWDFLAGVLARYGIAVIGGWMRRGVIGEKLAEKRVQAPTLPQHALNDSLIRDEIAVMTVGDALRVFQTDILPNNKWQPNRGAALTSYFIGQCLFRYGNAVQQWQRDNRPDVNGTGYAISTDPHSLDEVVSSQRDRASAADIEDDLVRDETARQAVSNASNPRAARALALEVLGYSDREIAEDLGITPKAVSSLLERERARSRTTRRSAPEGPT